MTTAITAPLPSALLPSAPLPSDPGAPTWSMRWRLFWAGQRQTPEDLAFAAGERAGFLDRPREPDPLLPADRREAWLDGYDAGHMAATHW